MPLELKYLPLIESSLIPYIKSHMGATGLWQFMYETGKEYGLKTNTIYDERCDANKSTEAACTYLRSLYERYDNWLLALSAYNCGPGNVNKAIQRAGTKNYFQVAQYLPEETQLYVPKFITYSYIFNYSGKLNVPCFSDDFFYTDTIIVKEDISLQFISDMIKVEYSQLRYYNSVYTSGIVPEGYPVYIPSTKISEYLRIFEKREGVEQDGIKTEIPELIEPEQTPQSQEQEQTNPDENMFNTIKPE
jgi:membrane-bound lytic murein transglycosylase D